KLITFFRLCKRLGAFLSSDSPRETGDGRTVISRLYFRPFEKFAAKVQKNPERLFRLSEYFPILLPMVHILKDCVQVVLLFFCLFSLKNG
ncbi:MAG: hypothetical protein IJV45_00410, partial [Prevotella sp.]|nr:hypothetical protein [Prevotella sp.]